MNGHSAQPWRRCWRNASLFSSALFLLAMLWSRAAEIGPATEYQVKAAFLYNFARFIDWPKENFATTNSPIVFGFAGELPFQNEVEQMLRGKTINSHPVVVTRFPDGLPTGPADVLFISRSERHHLDQILRAVRSKPTLTVGDGLDRFLQTGGMINFVIEDRKVRFEINATSAEKTGLKISSKLLRLAVRVQEDRAAQ